MKNNLSRKQFNFLGSITLFLLISVLIVAGCKTTKKKSEVGGIKKFYHNTTSLYNGFFNANVLMEEVILQLENDHKDNYTELLPIEKYMGSPNYKSSFSKLDTAIKKVSVVASVHRIGHWTDDCYLLAGKAHYIKRDYEAAEKTLKYLVKEFDPSNPKSQYWEYKDNPKEKKNKKKVSSSVLKNQYEQEARGDGGIGHDPAFNKGRLWLARTLTERDVIGRAQRLINQVKSNYRENDEINDLLHTTQAKLYIHEEKWQRAAEELSTAIDYAPDRDHRARYAFIVAQLYEKSGDIVKANIYYDKASSSANSYDLIFNAKLNKLKSDFKNNKRSRSSILSSLEKMTNDEKNTEYLDLIYYTMAEIYKADKDYDTAVKHYEKALAKRSKGSTVTLESYQALAYLYYGRDAFVKANNYLDSCLMIMESTNENYVDVKDLSTKLTPIAKNLKTIRDLDSLIAISNMSPEEQREVAAAMKVEDEKNKESAGSVSGRKGNKKMKINPSGSLSGRGNSQGRKSPRRGKYTGSFFAYQKDKKEKRRENFKEKWGDVPLVDNWRVSSMIDKSEIDNSSSEEEKQNIAATELISDSEVEKYLKDVPQSESELRKAEARISEAMFQLGFLYRSRLERPDLTIEILEELLERFPNNPKKLDAYYNLYLAYDSVNRKEKAEEYKNLILNRHPQSAIAKFLKDPAYAKSEDKKKQKLKLFYQNTYDDYMNGKYDNVHARVATANSNFGKDNQYAAKFSLLDAMATGKTKGEAQYANALRDLIKNHKGTDEEVRAKEILRFLNGDNTAFTGDLSNSNFTVDDEKYHYILVSINNPNKVNKRDAKISISEFNTQYFKLDKLKVSTIFLDIKDNSSPIIIVRRFENKKKAMRFYETAQQFKKDFMPIGAEYEMYAVNQKNYREILKTKTLADYREFFEKHYLTGN